MSAESCLLKAAIEIAYKELGSNICHWNCLQIITGIDREKNKFIYFIARSCDIPDHSIDASAALFKCSINILSKIEI